MPSLTSQLTQDGAGSTSVGTEAPARAPQGREVSSPVAPGGAAERDALAAAASAEKVAAQLGEEMEKVASDGGRVPEHASELRRTLLKLAHYVPELVRACHARTKYAEYCLEQAAHGASREEALKLASEMHADGMLEIPEGQTFEDMVMKLGREDLRVFKRAHELVASGTLGRFGEVDVNEKKARQGDGPLGDSDEEFLAAHRWLG